MNNHHKQQLKKAIEKKISEYQQKLNIELNASSSTRLYWLNRIEELERKNGVLCR